MLVGETLSFVVPTSKKSASSFIPGDPPVTQLPGVIQNRLTPLAPFHGSFAPRTNWALRRIRHVNEHRRRRDFFMRLPLHVQWTECALGQCREIRDHLLANI